MNKLFLSTNEEMEYANQKLTTDESTNYEEILFNFYRRYRFTITFLTSLLYPPISHFLLFFEDCYRSEGQPGLYRSFGSSGDILYYIPIFIGKWCASSVFSGWLFHQEKKMYSILWSLACFYYVYLILPERKSL